MNHNFSSILKRTEKWRNKKGRFFVCLIYQYDTELNHIFILKLFIFKIAKENSCYQEIMNVPNS